MKHCFLDVKIMLTHVADLVLLAVGGYVVQCIQTRLLSAQCEG
jgi:hypothetical protein